MRYTIRSSEEILTSVSYFCDYYKLIKEYIDQKLIRSSVDRGAFARPQFALDKGVYAYLGSKRQSNSFAYGPESGDIEIRSKIAILENKKYGTTFSKENIAIVAGARCGVELVLEELTQLRKGTSQKISVAVIGPTHYQLFHRAINILGINVHSFDFINPGLGSTPITESEIDMVLESKPCAVFITNPNNPNGEYFPPPLLASLIQKAEKKGIYIIIDELQDFFSKEGKGLLYSSWIQSPMVIRIDSFSKKRGLAEYRNGWVIADQHILGDRINGVIGRFSGLMGNAPRAANTAISKILDLEILRIDDGVDYFDYLNNKLSKRETYVRKILAGIPGIQVLNRDGCYNLTIKVDGFDSDIQLSKLLMDRGALIMPCSGYGYNPSDVVMRITFAERWHKIRHALGALKNCVLDRNTHR